MIINKIPYYSSYTEYKGFIARLNKATNQHHVADKWLLHKLESQIPAKQQGFLQLALYFFLYPPCLCTLKNFVTLLMWNKKYLINGSKIQTQKNPSRTDSCLLIKFPQERSSVIMSLIFYSINNVFVLHHLAAIYLQDHNNSNQGSDQISLRTTE